MDILDLIKERSSCRCIQEKEIPMSVLERILDSGIAAPTAHNTQAYKIVVVQGQRIKKISEEILRELNQYGNWKIPIGSSKRITRILRDAPVNLFLFIKKNCFFRTDRLLMELPGDYMDYIRNQNQMQSILSVGTVIENILLAAESEGIGAICISEICYAKDFCQNYFKNVVDLNDYEFASSVALGYREDIRFTKAKKKTREELIVFDVDK